MVMGVGLNLKEMDSREIFESLKESINDVFQKFQYTEISKQDYYRIALNEISTSKQTYKGDIPYSDFLVKRISKSLIDVSKNITRTPELKFKVINNYINQEFAGVLAIDDLIKHFDSLSYILEVYDYVPDSHFLERLINENFVFNTMIQSIVNHYYSQITSGNLESTFDNELLMFSIEVYCSINDIEIKRENFEHILNDSSFINDSFKAYIHEISKIPLLTSEEEKELAKKIATGDQEAKNKFIECNLRLVVSIAKRYVNRGLPLLDLIQEGNFVLMTAIEKFDPDKDFRFSSFAFYWIRQAITRAIANMVRNVRIPVSMYQKINLYRNTINILTERLNRKPTLEEIANEMKLPVSNIVSIYQASNPEMSINRVVGEDNDTEMVNLIPSLDDSVEDVAIQRLLRYDIKKLFEKSNLTEMEINVLSLRYGLCGQKPLSLSNIGKQYNCTREWVRQVESRALLKLRASSYIKELAIYAQRPDEVLKNMGKGEFEMKGIYKYLKDYTKEQIDEMLTKLSDENIELLKLKFGDDFSENEKKQLSKAEASRFYYVLVPKMKRIMSDPTYVPRNKKNKPKNKESIEKDNTKEETLIVEERKESVSSVAVNATTVEKETISTDTGNENTLFVASSETVEAGKVLKKDKSNDITKSECEGILKLLRTPSFGQMLGVLSVKEAVIISLKLGYVDGKCFSTESIANFLEIGQEEVVETTKKILLLYRENINEFLDKIIETASSNEKDSKKIIK